LIQNRNSLHGHIGLVNIKADEDDIDGEHFATIKSNKTTEGGLYGSEPDTGEDDRDIVTDEGDESICDC